MSGARSTAFRVPVLYKISTLVDRERRVDLVEGSRSLQNFYSCRWARLCRPRSVPVLYKISTLVDLRAGLRFRAVPVLYKISTLVDRMLTTSARRVPVLYKISTLVD